MGSFGFQFHVAFFTHLSLYVLSTGSSKSTRTGKLSWRLHTRSSTSAHPARSSRMILPLSGKCSLPGELKRILWFAVKQSYNFDLALSNHSPNATFSFILRIFADFFVSLPSWLLRLDESLLWIAWYIFEACNQGVRSIFPFLKFSSSSRLVTL